MRVFILNPIKNFKYVYVGHSFLKTLSHLFDHNGVKYWLCSQKAEVCHLKLNDLNTSFTLSRSIFYHPSLTTSEVVLIKFHIKLLCYTNKRLNFVSRKCLPLVPN